jgi:hypothetical protein
MVGAVRGSEGRKAVMPQVPGNRGHVSVCEQTTRTRAHLAFARSGNRYPSSN